MPDFKLVSDFQPTGDQPEAIRLLSEGLRAGYGHQTLARGDGHGKDICHGVRLSRPSTAPR